MGGTFIGRREELVVLPSPAELLLLGGGDTVGVVLLSPAELLLEKGQNDLDGSRQLAEPEACGDSLEISGDVDAIGKEGIAASLLPLPFLSLKNSLSLLEYLDEDINEVDDDRDNDDVDDNGIPGDVNDDDVDFIHPDNTDDDVITDVVDTDDDEEYEEALGDVGVVCGMDTVLDGEEQRELFKLM